MCDPVYQGCVDAGETPRGMSPATLADAPPLSDPGRWPTLDLDAFHLPRFWMWAEVQDVNDKARSAFVNVEVEARLLVRVSHTPELSVWLQVLGGPTWFRAGDRVLERLLAGGCKRDGQVSAKHRFEDGAARTAKSHCS
jgi:hypothetical protein